MMTKLIKRIIREIKSYDIVQWMTFIGIVWIVGYCIFLKLKFLNATDPLAYFPFVMGKNFFESSEKMQKVGVAADPYQAVREPLVDWLSKQIGQPGESYTGEIVAPMSDEEKRSMEFLKTYADSGKSRVGQLGSEEVQKTLSGDYNPTTSPYYQAVKAESARLLGEQQKNIGELAAAKGRYQTGGRIAEQSRAGTEVVQGLNTLLGSLAEKERERRLQAAQMAQAIGQYEEQDPLRKAAALQEFGALPRGIDQAANEALYREWMRVNQDYPLNIAQLASGVQQAPLYSEIGYEPSGFSKMLGQFANTFAGQAGESLGSKIFK